MSVLVRSRIVQVTNVSPSATCEQLRTLFGHVGVLEEVIIYPPDDKEEAASKVCYIRYQDPINAEVALHLNNTVFLDRALIVLPLAGGRDAIPDEKYANLVRAPPNTAAGVLPRTADWPLDVISMVVGRPGEQVIQTLEPRLSSLGFPLYPPLAAATDGSRIEEIRRTILVTNLDPKTTGDQVLEFFNKHAEVRCVRMAGTEFDRAAYVEFTQQPSIVKAFGLMGATLNGRQIMVQHSNCAIIKPANSAALIEDAAKRAVANESASSVGGHSSKHSDRGRSRTRSRDRKSRSRRRSTSRKRRSRSRDRRRSGSRHSRNRRTSRTRSRSRGRRRHSRSYSRERRRTERGRSRSRDRRKYRSRSRSNRYSRSRSRDHRSDRRLKDRERVDRNFRDRNRERERERVRERDPIRDRTHERDRNRDRTHEVDRRERDRDRDKDRERNRDRERDRERDRDKTRTREKDREGEQESKSKRHRTEESKTEVPVRSSRPDRKVVKNIESPETVIAPSSVSKSNRPDHQSERRASSCSSYNSNHASDNESPEESIAEERDNGENGGPLSENEESRSEPIQNMKPTVVGVKLAGPEDMDHLSHIGTPQKVSITNGSTDSDSSGEAMDTEA